MLRQALVLQKMSVHECVCVCARVCEWLRAYIRACVRVCEYVCACVCVFASWCLSVCLSVAGWSFFFKILNDKAMLCVLQCVCVRV